MRLGLSEESAVQGLAGTRQRNTAISSVQASALLLILSHGRLS
jgi:hypothetical protein